MTTVILKKCCNLLCPTLVYMRELMCSECDWSEEKGVNHQIRKKCDCGNLKWQWTSLVINDNHLESSMKAIYRCTKCDSLRLAQHLLHPSSN